MVLMHANCLTWQLPAQHKASAQPQLGPLAGPLDFILGWCLVKGSSFSASCLFRTGGFRCHERGHGLIWCRSCVCAVAVRTVLDALAPAAAALRIRVLRLYALTTVSNYVSPRPPDSSQMCGPRCAWLLRPSTSCSEVCKLITGCFRYRVLIASKLALRVIAGHDVVRQRNVSWERSGQMIHGLLLEFSAVARQCCTLQATHAWLARAP